MKHRAFFWFVLPSATAMLLFIFFPIISVLIQSVYVEHDQVIVTVENCGPFGCTQSTAIDQEATEELRRERPFGRFAGLETYLDRNHLAVDEVATAWDRADNWRDLGTKMLNLPFYKAMGFTLTFTFVVTPLVIIFGFIIAVAVNSAAKSIRGPLIFFSLLPMMVTPLIGSLILFWMIDARGIIGSSLQISGGRPGPVGQGLDADNVDHADGLWRLAFGPVCVHRLLRGSANGEQRHVGIGAH